MPADALPEITNVTMIPPYSNANCPGSIFAIGNVGGSLDESNNPVFQTFYSADGGNSWITARPTPNYYGITNYGSLLLTTEFEQYDGVVSWSMDSAVTWSSCNVNADTSNTGRYIVSGIYSDDAASSKSFLVTGRRVPSQTGRQGPNSGYVITFVDFSSLYPTCRGYDTYVRGGVPSDNNNDFELYPAPNFGYPGECFNGVNTTWIRKKPGVNCFLPRNFNPVYSTTICPCAFNDYVCDYCYITASLENGEQRCVRDNLCGPFIAPECPPEGYYYLPTGYRIAPGDMCSESSSQAEDWGPTITACTPCKCNGNSSNPVGTPTQTATMSPTPIGCPSASASENCPVCPDGNNRNAGDGGNNPSAIAAAVVFAILFCLETTCVLAVIAFFAARWIRQRREKERNNMYKERAISEMSGESRNSTDL
eukprot:TRINITY_DN3845_c0_g1_i1.p1 TRINITY_DN3845_c0_g1~~TRINITY_DN3845_c0_g1_i1.p1  ORF type:complete len:423 (-),score=60.09 TRINITY_DN3845_c0_g1_i1:85-1353(-)